MGKSFMHTTKIESLPLGNLHETPYSMTEQFLDMEDFEGSILEPCAGNGAIVKVLSRKYTGVVSYDLNYGENKKDFLLESREYSNIITNPPFGKMADLMVLHAKKLYTSKIAMLLRTNYLSGAGRFKLNVYSELSKVYVFTRMSDLRFELRDDGKYPTAGIVYAWFVWEKNYLGSPRILWIDNSKYCLLKKDKLIYEKEKKKNE